MGWVGAVLVLPEVNHQIGRRVWSRGGRGQMCCRL
jgi:hypothetical protein